MCVTSPTNAVWCIGGSRSCKFFWLYVSHTQLIICEVLHLLLGIYCHFCDWVYILFGEEEVSDPHLTVGASCTIPMHLQLSSKFNCFPKISFDACFNQICRERILFARKIMERCRKREIGESRNPGAVLVCGHNDASVRRSNIHDTPCSVIITHYAGWIVCLATVG